MEILWNLCEIYEEFLWKSMVPQHIVEGQCGIFVEIIRKFVGKSSSTVWNFCGNYKEICWKIQFHSVEFNVKF